MNLTSNVNLIKESLLEFKEITKNELNEIVKDLQNKKTSLLS
jgi:hypothetical protein